MVERFISKRRTQIFKFYIISTKFI